MSRLTSNLSGVTYVLNSDTLGGTTLVASTAAGKPPEDVGVLNPS
jgi:hypothetical protein